MIDKKRTILFFVSLIGIIITSLVLVTTYAYQSVQTDYKGDNNIGGEDGLNVANLEVSYTATNKIELSNMPLLPDHKTADYVEFTIDNTKSTEDAAYQINLINLEYSESLITESFKYTITKIDFGHEFVLGNGDFSSLTGNSINLPFNIQSYRILENGKSETLRLYLWIEDTGNVQDLENSNFKGNIEIISLFSSDVTERLYKTLKVHGNSVQDGIPSLETPIEIKNLGTLITDENDANHGKYEISLSVKSKKNIADLSQVENFVTEMDKAMKKIIVSRTFVEIFEKDGRPVLRMNSDTGYYWNSSQKIPNYANLAKIFKDIFKENTQYTISFDYYVRDSKQYMNLLIKYTDGTYDSGSTLMVNDNSLTNNTYSFSYTTKEGKTVSSFEHTYNSGTTYIYLDTIQIEEGTTKTDYEPYILFDSKIYLNEPLRKVNDDSDYIDFVNQAVVRNVEVVDDTHTLLLANSYAKLEVPKYENIELYVPSTGSIEVCSSNNICASNIEIETNK